MFDVLRLFTRRDIVTFFVSFMIGILFVCLIESKPEIIVRWPTPDNAGLVTYMDRADNCYKYESAEVECTENAKHIPLQTGEGMHSDNTHNQLSGEREGVKIIMKDVKWDESFV